MLLELTGRAASRSDDGDRREVGRRRRDATARARHLVAAAAQPGRHRRARRRRTRCVEAAQGLRYRDFLTVALVLDGEDLFPDNWIYIHEPGVRVGRIQNYRSWSPWMVPDEPQGLPRPGVLLLRGRRAVDDGRRRRWSSSPTRELEQLGLVAAERSSTRLRRARAEGVPDVRRRLRRARRDDPRAGSTGSSTCSRSAATACTATTTPTTRSLTAIRAVENILLGRRPRHLGGQRRERLPRGGRRRDEQPYRKAPETPTMDRSLVETSLER